MENIGFADEDAIRGALAAVRSDDDPTDWMVISYTDNKAKTLELIGSGSDGMAEFIAAFEDTKVMYGVGRVTDQIDDSVTIKFVYVEQIGEKANRMLKARVSTHKGFITELLKPYHVDFHIDTPSDITPEMIDEKVGVTSGSKSRVMDSEAAAARYAELAEKEKLRGPKKGGFNTETATQALCYEGKDEIDAMIRDVRSDASDTDWFLVSYQEGSSDTLVPHSSGSRGLDEFTSRLDDSQAMYGIVRVTTTIDKTVAVKFVAVHWAGNQLERRHKGMLSTHKGAVDELLAPYHILIIATQLSDLRSDVVSEKVEAAAGTKDNVRVLQE